MYESTLAKLSADIRKAQKIVSTPEEDEIDVLLRQHVSLKECTQRQVELAEQSVNLRRQYYRIYENVRTAITSCQQQKQATDTMPDIAYQEKLNVLKVWEI